MEGDQGDKGGQGPPGDQGEAGKVGQAGPAGPRGPKVRSANKVGTHHVTTLVVCRDRPDIMDSLVAMARTEREAPKVTKERREGLASQDCL